MVLVGAETSTGCSRSRGSGWSISSQARSRGVAELITGRCVLPAPADMQAWIEADRDAMAARYQRSEPHETMQVDYWRYIRALAKERARRRHAVTRRMTRALVPLRVLRGHSG